MCIIDSIYINKVKPLLKKRALQNQEILERVTQTVFETFGAIKDLKIWCEGFTLYLNKNTPINIKFNLMPSEAKDEDSNYAIHVTKITNGVKTSQEPLNKYFFSSDGYQELIGLSLNKYTMSSFTFSDKDSDKASKGNTLSNCFTELFSLSKGSISLQRYKGLGEMNPGQLEETTMNTKSRTLLQVLPLEDGNQVVVELMGDDVELRKEFIKQKYSSVKNLDI